MLIQSAEQFKDAFYELLIQNIRWLLPKGSTSVSMGVTHIYSTGTSNLLFRPEITKTANGYVMNLSAGETNYFDWMLGYNSNGTKKTPRMNSKEPNQQREVANSKILATALQNTCNAMGIQYSNVTFTITGEL